MKRSHWYAIRIVPGFQRMAAVDERLPEARRLESLVERNCREGGFDIFMPSFCEELRHHRTHKIIEKRFPFMVGYAFVNLPRLNFEELRRVEGVMGLLRGGIGNGPLQFPDGTIEALYFAEHERKQAFLYAQHCRRENERLGRVKHLRGQLRQILPKGRAVRASMVDQAAKAIDSLSPQLKERVEKILSELNGLTADMDVENLRQAV